MKELNYVVLVYSVIIKKLLNLNPSIYQKDANKDVNVFFGTITKALSRNERVELRGFGVFDVKKEKHGLLEIQKMVLQLQFQKRMSPFSEWVKVKDRLNK